MATAESAKMPAPSSAIASGSKLLVDVLKPAEKAELSRKRKIENPKASGERKRKTTVTNPTDPRNVSPVDRVKEFPNECLTVRQGKLFCFACCEELSLKKSTVKNHIFSRNKHKNSKELEERVYRVRVVESFLKAGIPKLMTFAVSWKKVG